MSRDRKDLSKIKLSTTNEIVDGEHRKELEKEYEARFEEFCELFEPIVGYSKIRRPKGVKSDNGDYIISVNEKGWFFNHTQNYTVDVKGHWVSYVQGAKKSFCDLTFFMDAIGQGKIAVLSYDEMVTNLRYNRGMKAYYLPDEYYESLEDSIGEYKLVEVEK